MITVGAKVLYKNMNNPKDVRLAEVVDINNNVALRYGLRTERGHRLNASHTEVELTTKLFAKCLIVGGSGGSAYFRMAKDFAGSCIENRPDTIENSVDLVLFTGGEDVSPYLYGEEPHVRTFFNPQRDAQEAQVYRMAKDKGIPCLGICRGAQFLNVMNKGRMVQNVTGHTSNHDMHIPGGSTIHVTSTHHQMMDPAENAVMLGWADGISTEYSGLKDFQPCMSDDNRVMEPEVLWYEKSKDLCVQYHPETMDAGSRARNYLLEILKKLK